METKIKQQYVNPAQVGSFSGAENFIKDSKTLASRVDVLKTLHHVTAYYLHKQIRKRFPRRRVLVNGIHEQYAMDLKDIQKTSSFNNRQKYILVVIDVFSKKGYLEAIKNKTSKVV